MSAFLRLADGLRLAFDLTAQSAKIRPAVVRDHKNTMRQDACHLDKGCVENTYDLLADARL